MMLLDTNTIFFSTSTSASYKLFIVNRMKDEESSGELLNISKYKIEAKALQSRLEEKEREIEMLRSSKLVKINY